MDQKVLRLTEISALMRLSQEVRVEVAGRLFRIAFVVHACGPSRVASMRHPRSRRDGAQIEDDAIVLDAGDDRRIERAEPAFGGLR